MKRIEKQAARGTAKPAGETGATPPKTVLIATVGTSPGVLTETLWALAHAEDPALRAVPDEIEWITTEPGAAAFRESLEQTGLWKRLRDTLAQGEHAGKLRLRGPCLVEALRPATGCSAACGDVRDTEATSATADLLLGIVKKHAGARLIASISGGRKSMSALLYGAMTVAGSRGDRVVHAVPDPLLGEHSPREYFFPGQGGVVTTRATPDAPARTLDCAHLRPTLAELPFVPLGDKFAGLKERHADFSGLVRAIHGELDDAPLPPRIAHDALILGGRRIAFADLGTPELRTVRLAGPILSRLYDRAWMAEIVTQKNESFAPRLRLALEAELGIPDTDDQWLSKFLSAIRRACRQAGVAPSLVTSAVPNLRSIKKAQDWPCSPSEILPARPRVDSGFSPAGKTHRNIT